LSVSENVSHPYYNSILSLEESDEKDDLNIGLIVYIFYQFELLEDVKL